MSYKQIDEQFNEKFGISQTREDAFCVWENEVKSFLHLIYDQAKAEQREIDAEIAERSVSDINYHDEDGVRYLHDPDIGISMRWEEGHNYACNKIATAIRQEGK